MLRGLGYLSAECMRDGASTVRQEKRKQASEERCDRSLPVTWTRVATQENLRRCAPPQCWWAWEAGFTIGAGPRRARARGRTRMSFDCRATEATMIVDGREAVWRMNAFVHYLIVRVLILAVLGLPIFWKQNLGCPWKNSEHLHESLGKTL
jgi:hypothetical protein